LNISQLIFRNYGGSYQLSIQNAEDLEKIQALDEVHWAAISIPIDSLHCDKAFTAYVDTYKNGRIRPEELKAAQSWLYQVLSDRRRLSEGSDVLRLEDINTAQPEGKKLRTAAERILTNLNVTGTNEITLAQVRDVQSIMASAANNGDGIIPPDAAPKADLSQFITSVMDTVGSQKDASGKPGIGEAELKEFFHQAAAYLAWIAKGELPKGRDQTDVMPWGNDTTKAYALLINVEEKVEQFFAQCAIISFDKRAAPEMQLREKELKEIDFSDTSAMVDRLKNSPLALPNVEGLLSFEDKVNPLFVDDLRNLKEKVLERALGSSVKRLSEKEWHKVKSIFGAYRAWLEGKQGSKVEKLGRDLLRSYLDGPFREQTGELIKKDLVVADDLKEMHNLEKLILYQKWLMVLANNFVSFADLYNPRRRALFETGTLLIDERQIVFTMGVSDRQAHKKISERSSMYLLYVEVTGRGDKDITFEIVAPVTSGNADGLCVGKRGIFFTVDGREWDAKVVDVVANPISIWESVKAPFQKFAEFIRKQIDKMTKSGQDKLASSASSGSTSGAARDLMLGGGLAIAALGSSFAYITKALSQVKPTQILLVLLGLATVVLLPGIFAGFMKIRGRNLSGLLEASGWAVNVHMRINTAMGRLFTRSPRLPKDARKERRDIIAEFVKEHGLTSPRTRGPTTVVLIVILLVLCMILFLTNFSGWKLLF